MLTPTQPRPRECAQCHSFFNPQRMGMRVCSPICASRLVRAENAVKKAEFKARKEAVKPRGKLIEEAQKAFNAFIRARDAGKPCICCGKEFEPEKHGGSADAGHYLSRGSAPHLRFDENNCFAQRKNCNRPGGTTRQAFRAGVVARIGLEAVEALEADTSVKKWTADDLRAIKATYAAKCRELKKEKP